ncbi:hypothetical protein TrRE_jg11238 [Triparma retinervis]|uniref:DUF559 domain-containing protein n=1 Tax=Triparma retinervis TaxID=2557542 RepID=A0A9W7E8J6_9STRA|nr:hypothetical protein TrRE_jg11238 [Triparma retinervis]
MREEVTRAARRRIGSPSEFENHITRELEKFGFGGFEREVSPFEGDEGGELLKIDIAWVDKKVALELDGPSHFLKVVQDGKGGKKKRSNGGKEEVAEISKGQKTGLESRQETAEDEREGEESLLGEELWEVAGEGRWWETELIKNLIE